MITYLNVKTNTRYPEFGCESHFSEKEKINKKGEKVIKLEYFIRGQGWKNAKKNEFIKEEIQDLGKPFTDQQFIEYSNKYGINCAQEFLDCCDYMKPRAAYQIFNPPKNQEIWDNPQNLVWFKTIFNQDLHRFICGTSIAFGNIYNLDILKFENYLAYEFGYPKNKDGSMKDFMVTKFGIENTEKFQELFLKNKN